jgi:hypothetical protein
MPILIDELIVEAEPPRSPQPPPQASAASSFGEAPQAKISQGDRMLELSIVADRHHRLQVD